MSLHRFDCEGASLAFADSGSGLPVVFLHPTPVDHRFWTPLIARLQKIRSLAPDMRGHGASELGTLPVSLFDRVPDAPVLNAARMASDVLALLDHLAISKAAVVACSFGGYTALELWRRAPERMLGLAFLCTKPQPDPSAAQDKRAANVAQARAGRLSSLLDAMIESCTGVTAKAAQPGLVAEIRALARQTPEAYTATQAGIATRPDAVATVPTIRVPLLALSGGEDLASSREEMLAFLTAGGPRVDYTFLANAGHFAAYEQPGAVASVVQSWLELLV
jgi:3-oxoadipate enol-lactonase